MVKTPHSQRTGPGFDPWSGNQIPNAATKSPCAATKGARMPPLKKILQVATKIPCAATKTQSSQINKRKKKNPGVRITFLHMILESFCNCVTHRHREQICGFQGGGGAGWSGSLGLAAVNYYIIYGMDKQQGPTVWHRELYSISCDKP